VLFRINEVDKIELPAAASVALKGPHCDPPGRSARAALFASGASDEPTMATATSLRVGLGGEEETTVRLPSLASTLAAFSHPHHEKP
jgi:hypothetical protein